MYGNNVVYSSRSFWDQHTSSWKSWILGTPSKPSPQGLSPPGRAGLALLAGFDIFSKTACHVGTTGELFNPLFEGVISHHVILDRGFFFHWSKDTEALHCQTCQRLASLTNRYSSDPVGCHSPETDCDYCPPASKHFECRCQKNLQCTGETYNSKDLRRIEKQTVRGLPTTIVVLFKAQMAALSSATVQGLIWYIFGALWMQAWKSLLGTLNRWFKGLPYISGKTQH